METRKIEGTESTNSPPGVTTGGDSSSGVASESLSIMKTLGGWSIGWFWSWSTFLELILVDGYSCLITF